MAATECGLGSSYLHEQGAVPVHLSTRGCGGFQDFIQGRKRLRLRLQSEAQGPTNKGATAMCDIADSTCCGACLEGGDLACFGLRAGKWKGSQC
jgi:hypothetical protein